MKKILPLSVAFVFVLMGCKSTYLKQSTNVSNVKKSYDKILVVTRSKDKTARIKAEQQLVQDLAERGVIAESSIQVIQMESFSKELTVEDLEKLRMKMVAKGYSGIVVTNLINTEQYSDVVSGGVGTAYYPVRYRRFGRYYSYYPVSYWEPDRVETGVEYTLESCLYDLTVDQKDNLQWVGRFQVRNPTDLVATIEKYSTELANELLAQSIDPQ